ncbi:MAG: glycosyltransferase [Acidobacteria bacterium]|nr:glycosyltransferase [Acidobacteriota bacterium]
MVLKALFWIYVLLGIAYWAAWGWFTRILRRAPRAGPEEPGTEGKVPLVLVLVPARNEERGIEACLRSLLAQEYPRIRILLADDGSTDGTRAIAESIGAGDGRLEIVDPGEPPEGWVGKCWALHRAYEHARERGYDDGALLLFTDADVVFHPRAIPIGVRRLLQERLDLLALLPRSVHETFWERTVQSAVVHALLVLGTIARLYPLRKAPRMASGAFLLVRPEYYRIAGGHHALRHEIIEDVALATTVHMRGGRTGALMAPDLVRVRMYHGLREIWQGWAKNFFAGTGDSLRRASELILVCLLFWVAPAPLLLFLLGRAGATGSGWSEAAGAGILWAAMTAVRAAGNRITGDPPAFALVHPLAGAILIGLLAASAWSRRFGRGALWRGRRYPAPKAAS